jgi:hypothetical protein
MFLIFVVATLYFTKVSPTIVNNLNNTKQDLSSLSEMNITLENTNITPNISANQAIESAIKTFGKRSTNINVEYYLITSYPGMIRTPAYIVSFEDTPYSFVSVPYGFKGKIPVHHEYNVIVNAETGKAMIGFSYR